MAHEEEAVAAESLLLGHLVRSGLLGQDVVSGDVCVAMMFLVHI